MGIFTTALRNKKISQILTKNTSPYFHSALLVIWPLTTLKGTHLSELSILRFSTYIRKALFLWGTTSKAQSEDEDYKRPGNEEKSKQTHSKP